MDDLTRADGTRIAVRRHDGAVPAILFLPGNASDMTGAKALALDDWAARTGRAFVRFDYGGCGESEGAFAEQGLENWFGDALAVLDATPGQVVLVGSSMGGWLALLVAMVRPARIAALIGIAAAPDFTDWGFTEAEKTQLMRGQALIRPSAYGPPLVTTARFWGSGQAMRLPRGEIAIDCPVRLLHGQADPDVPWEKSIALAERLRSPDVQVNLVKDGDHRLSRPQDIALLIATIEGLTPAP
ncbi:MAG: alpha/beta hydrolase [Sphingomonadaceae bacterium]